MDDIVGRTVSGFDAGFIVVNVVWPNNVDCCVDVNNLCDDNCSDDVVDEDDVGCWTAVDCSAAVACADDTDGGCVVDLPAAVTCGDDIDERSAVDSSATVTCAGDPVCEIIVDC